MVGKVFQIVFMYFLLLLCSTACNREEEVHNRETKELEVCYVYPYLVTDMSSSSVIALPSGTSAEGSLFNSKEEVEASIPSEVIGMDSSYGTLDFSENTLLSLKFRFFYNIDKIDSRIYVVDRSTMLVKQSIYVSGPIVTDGRFVMSNLLLPKMSGKYEISIEQSLFFNAE